MSHEKKTKSETTSSTTRCKPQDFEETLQNEFRLKQEATQEKYTVTKGNDTTKKLKEIKFLSTSTARLSEKDEFIINM